jgi:hypothetical protein
MRNTRLNRIVAGIVVSASAFVASAAFAADTPGGVCISDQAKQSLNSCSNNGPTSFNVGAHGKSPQVNFHSAPPPADLKKRDQQKAPSNPTETQPRDDRKSRL